ncbi:MAG: hypothetical protein U9O98_07730 [Asgard group archaeon]|nr:hypothetical protein [Asgard group archaeon]
MNDKKSSAKKNNQQELEQFPLERERPSFRASLKRYIYQNRWGLLVAFIGVIISIIGIIIYYQLQNLGQNIGFWVLIAGLLVFVFATVFLIRSRSNI